MSAGRAAMVNGVASHGEPTPGAATSSASSMTSRGSLLAAVDTTTSSMAALNTKDNTAAPPAAAAATAVPSTPTGPVSIPRTNVTAATPDGREYAPILTLGGKSRSGPSDVSDAVFVYHLLALL